ncbi:D-2-hydroxyacid dehydrogenase [Rhizobium sp. BK251]|uniref:D-2-hydroxyacid dehydrogenase n=1 Tax=Rhizobium sp. BK251 TaxID=2512125 RepID=UPI00104FAB3E|nr:D-2-hydroxyacid dehydrogenase [Rhizobium sp. BK251]TCL68171.1 phosphoglycerate dehydrogenase-like enzyme [Rhizobium sp. BK251]
MTEQQPRIVAVGGFTVEQQNLLRRAGGNCSIEFVKDAAGLVDSIEVADAVAGHIAPAILGRARRLRWVHSWAAGPDTQLYREFVEHPVILTCSKGNGAIPLAEHAMMLMLMLNRDALRWLKAQAERRWDPFTHGELNGLTLGIVGAGHSGTDLARKAKAFHMRVLGLRRTATRADGFDEIFPRKSLHAFLAQSDFVVVSAPLTPETEHMLGEAEFRAMKPSAYFICFSRGGIADDAALLRALSENWIAGAGLDAHGIEPLPADSPFWSLPNTIITPHNGATTAATRARGIEIFAENLRRFAAGMPLINAVDKAAGY